MYCVNIICDEILHVDLWSIYLNPLWTHSNLDMCKHFIFYYKKDCIN